MEEVENKLLSFGIDIQIKNMDETFMFDLMSSWTEGKHLSDRTKEEHNPYINKSEMVDAVCAYFIELEKYRKEKGLSSNA